LLGVQGFNFLALVENAVNIYLMNKDIQITLSKYSEGYYKIKALKNSIVVYSTSSEAHRIDDIISEKQAKALVMSVNYTVSVVLK